MLRILAVLMLLTSAAFAEQVFVQQPYSPYTSRDPQHQMKLHAFRHTLRVQKIEAHVQADRENMRRRMKAIPPEVKKRVP